jgi:uncharacterized protein (TIGR02145 family)
MKTKIKTCFYFSCLMGIIQVALMSCNKDDNRDEIKDADGNLYTSVTIGTQIWLLENLKTTRYNNGDLIGTTIPASLNIQNENNPKYQWAYEGDQSNVSAYGRMYTWHAATDSRKVCPEGWRLPTDEEWTTLAGFHGSINDAGGKLKETGTSHWSSPNTGADNESGFTALPGGKRENTGQFYEIGINGFYWTSSEISPQSAWYRLLWSEYANCTRTNNLKDFGYSVRCIKE